ncbi:MAG: hypothetical protein DMD78_04340 [Candidatus Rokuibacteriota bacterium]|nr:MAG: hypothetical protein DMD78_04340 [Candidatus Rokubacteria bacterium]
MATGIVASDMLAHEARALLARLARIKPFVITETMVPAAAVSPRAVTAIERYLATGRRELRARVNAYLKWLATPAARDVPPATLQQRFTFLRLRFNAVLTQFDIFADVLSQRSQLDNGLALSGLDVVAADALALPGGYYAPPPVICYLDRGHGAAIRRERTRLPGGGENPVAIVRVPRERMVGSGIASSLIHEVGHQAAALLDVLDSLRPLLHARHEEEPAERLAWRYWERWISEIFADFWSVARIGVASTLGLIGVVSLPRIFVFRLNPEDPHPIPWIRVKLSCAMGRALYPHPQWRAVEQLWESFYPRLSLAPDYRALLAALESTMPKFVELLVTHRPRSLRGRSLAEVMDTATRTPARLVEAFRALNGSPARLRETSPSLAFAIIGQARADGRIGPEEESRTLVELLQYWALRSTLDDAARASARPTADAQKTRMLEPSLN